ncbi:MAG: hypothetical protein H0U69_09755, partial [Trueperaceae bacterium]|nr:hypothetical protein [Trueperaceae bacterium]
MHYGITTGVPRGILVRSGTGSSPTVGRNVRNYMNVNLHAAQTNVMVPAGLLITKLRPPRGREAAPSRSRLLEYLRAEPAPVVVVTAGAGFGKSTLLSHWVASLDRHVGWISLDEGDNDASRFWSHLLGSLHGVVPGFAAYGVEVLRSPSVAPLEALLTELVNELAAADPVVLVLDDYHHIDDPGIHGGVTFLLSHLPDTVMVGIGSRSAPPLPLARMRGRGEVRDVDADALRATVDETAAFLRSGMNLELSDDAVASVLG